MNASLLERMGGRPALIKLLHHFYADVRQHKEIGPIFAHKINDWPHHLEKIADFWCTVAGGPPAYGGPMQAKHVPLGLKEEHIQAWLGLWEHNCKLWLPLDCAEEMMHFARKIADRLRMNCGLTPNRSLQITAELPVRGYGQVRPVPFQSALKA